MNRCYLVRLTTAELLDLLVFNRSVSLLLRSVAAAATAEISRRIDREIPGSWSGEPDADAVPAEAHPVRVPSWATYPDFAELLSDIYASLKMERQTVSFEVGRVFEATTDELLQQLAEKLDFEDRFSRLRGLVPEWKSVEPTLPSET
jgi:hypothetical protein